MNRQIYEAQVDLAVAGRYAGDEVLPRVGGGLVLLAEAASAPAP